MMLTDENGECIETASNLKAKFEALRLLEEAESKKKEQQPAKKFTPKRFKVRIVTSRYLHIEGIVHGLLRLCDLGSGE